MSGPFDLSIEELTEIAQLTLIVAVAAQAEVRSPMSRVGWYGRAVSARKTLAPQLCLATNADPRLSNDLESQCFRW
jgi:hypothetical protein